MKEAAASDSIIARQAVEILRGKQRADGKSLFGGELEKPFRL
jgi:hypothetical protein